MPDAPLQRPVVLYDGECGFCKRHVARWSALAGDRIEFLPFQEHADRFPQITTDALQRAVHLIEPDGSVTQGAQAVFRIAALSRDSTVLVEGKRLGRWAYENLPGFANLSEIGYRFIASHRNGVDPIDRALFGSSREPSSHRLTVSIFLRALGVVFLIAFVSLWVQIHGLVGSHGILPFAPVVESLKHLPASTRYLNMPTLCWINCSDTALTFYCAMGTVMSVLLIAGVMPFFMLVGLWVLYLSLAVAGQDFLEFQWDALLLEAGFAALFVAPFQVWMNSKTMREPSRIGVWLLRWLAFRIMFLSGVTKLIWNDACWRDGTALLYHYWTQPLPPWTAWYMNRLPLWFQKFSVVVMYLCEVAAPVLIFTPRMTRRIAFWATLLFQTLIIATGNYGFFNLLTIVIAISILDDSFWPRRIRRPPTVYRDQPWWTIAIRAPAAIVIVLLTSVAFAEVCRMDLDRWPRLTEFYHRAEYFRSTNWYALFRTMTQTRNELIIEGSDDGEHWKIYDFKYKPGPVDRRPEFVTPHMPRLDWQMWFEAINASEGGSPSRWFVAFLQRLLEGSPEVTELLRTNPFPDHPPKYVHVLRYDYHFADDPKGKAWWTRTLLGEYVPTVRLR